ncbi:MAG TPA: glutamate mutase L [Anaerolineales bacterium]
MTTSLLDADSLLAIDVGEVTTRAVLFDVVDGRYRFLAIGSAPTTAAAPYHDVGEGVRLAIDRLQEITGRKLVGADERLIMPSLADGSGVDTFAATLSAGPPLKIVAVGLLEDISLESARKLATTTYSRVVEALSLNDRRKQETRIDAILRHRPDLVVVAGGTDGGASQSVMQMIETVGLACYLLPEGHRPEVLFSGNQAVNEQVDSTLKAHTQLHIAPNVRPILEKEQIDPAQTQLAEIFRSLRGRQIVGVSELDAWTGQRLTPTAVAFGRVIRFLSRVYDPGKGVLGVDVGASATTIAAAFTGDLTLGVYPQLGLGKGLTGLLDHSSVGRIRRWLPIPVSEDHVRDYIHNKSLYPESIPANEEDLWIEQALARQAIRAGLSLASGGFPEGAARSQAGLLPWFEPVVAAGSVLTRAPSPAHSLLTLLDALQPTGATTLVLDQNNLAAPLGAAAAINSILVVQVLESSTFLSLGTVISPVARVRPGTPILRIRAQQDSGEEISMEIKQGTLEVLPLPLGRSARLNLLPLHRADIGMGGPGRGGNLKVTGGILGVVIDARGRPLRLPGDPVRKGELYKKWLWALGG